MKNVVATITVTIPLTLYHTTEQYARALSAWRAKYGEDGTEEEFTAYVAVQAILNGRSNNIDGLGVIARPASAAFYHTTEPLMGPWCGVAAAEPCIKNTTIQANP